MPPNPKKKTLKLHKIILKDEMRIKTSDSCEELNVIVPSCYFSQKGDFITHMKVFESLFDRIPSPFKRQIGSAFDTNVMLVILLAGT